MNRPTNDIRVIRSIVYTTVMILISGSLLLPAPAAQAQDQVGIYWDAGYTSNTATTATIPGTITGYVMLSHPTGTGGVLGWEGCIDVNGPATLTGWDFQGQAIDVGRAPCHVVGYASPLPAATDILLATFTAVVTDVGPIEVTMKPLWTASVPGEMSYIPGDAPGDLIIMDTAGGREVVAGLNGAVPGVTLNTTALDFGDVGLGLTSARTLSITNQSGAPLTINPSITNLCTYFTLPGGPGPFTIPNGTTFNLSVDFAPILERVVVCELDLGPNLPAISLTGNGVPPTPSWSITGTPLFGNVSLGTSKTVTVYLRNTGNINIDLQVGFQTSCPDMAVTLGGGPSVLLPGEQLAISVRFAPTTAGYQSCNLSFGHPDIPPLLFYGFGINPTPTWDAPTNYDFLANFVGIPATADLSIVNTGFIGFSLTPTLPGNCAEFSIVQGGGPSYLAPGATHVVRVQFVASVIGQFNCQLDLGNVVPAIALSAEAIASPGAITVTPSQLVFTNTLVTQSQDRDVIVANTAPYVIPLQVALAQPDSAFTILTGTNGYNLTPGSHLTITLRFTPPVAGDFNGQLNLGPGLPIVPLQGSGFAGQASCRLEPASLNFGTIFLGESATLPVSITNDGTTDMFLEPTTSTAAFFLDAVPSILYAGQTRTLQVRYQPTSAGSHSGFLLLGDQACSAVSLLGTADVDPASYTVAPDSLDFGTVPVNDVFDREILVTNLSPVANLQLNVSLQLPASDFSILTGGGPQLLGPGEAHRIVVQLRSFTAHESVNHVLLGAGLVSVPVQAVSEVVLPDCVVQETDLNFGDVAIGWGVSRSITVSNQTNSDLVLTPTSNSPYFQPVESSITLAPGSPPRQLFIQFTPTAVAPYEGLINLGANACAEVRCFGTGMATQTTGQDLVGIYFDSQYQNPIANAQYIGQVITGYLVLKNASNTGGVSAWECRADITRSNVFLGWTLAGQALNLSTAPEFIVGLAAPLPYTDHALLATFTVLVNDIGHDSELSLGPVQTPSLPDQMAWVPGDLPDVILPMRSATGLPVVAMIASQVLGVTAPTPHANLLGNQVDLSWPTPTTANDGCLVYRRLDGADPVRLTSEPLVSDGPQLFFTDYAEGLPAGATVHYSYAIVQAGNELARSAEVTVELPGVPVVATRLLPNVPNPFNPMTEIRFELNAPQNVSVRIYDVTGRLVRELANGSLPAGPHTRLWQGRDERGRQVPSGAYYVRLVTERTTDRRKIMLLK